MHDWKIQIKAVTKYSQLAKRRKQWWKWDSSTALWASMQSTATISTPPELSRKLLHFVPAQKRRSKKNKLWIKFQHSRLFFKSIFCELPKWCYQPQMYNWLVLIVAKRKWMFYKRCPSNTLSRWIGWTWSLGIPRLEKTGLWNIDRSCFGSRGNIFRCRMVNRLRLEILIYGVMLLILEYLNFRWRPW
jgi:hypothetical protein